MTYCRNRKNIRIFTIFFSVILIMGMLTACGDDGVQQENLLQSIAEIASGTADADIGDTEEAISSNAAINEAFHQYNGKGSEPVWAGTQFYNGEAVVVYRKLNGSEDMDKAQDIYLYDSKNNGKIIVSGAPNTYTGTWFYTYEGYCLTLIGNNLARIDVDGTEKFHIAVEGGVTGIVQLADSTIVLLLKDATGVYTLATLDPEKGAYEKVAGLDLGKDNRVFISAGEEGVVLLDKNGFRDVNLETGELTERIPLSEYDYTLQYTLKGFRMVGGGCVEMLYQGNSNLLLPKNIEKYRTVITVQTVSNDAWYPAMLDRFNKTNYEYYAQWDYISSETSDIASYEVLWELLENGEGPDVFLASALENEFDAIDKGYLEDLAPYMEPGGIYVEDYFPTTFDRLKRGESIYGVNTSIHTAGIVLKKEVLGGAEVTDTETLVDALLSYTTPAVWMENAKPVHILQDLLHASETLCGTVDWEKRTCNFHTDLFAKILEVSLQYADDGSGTFPAVAYNTSTSHFYHYINKEQRDLAGEVYLGYLFDAGPRPGSSSRQEMVMNSHSKNKEGAWAVISYLISEEAQKQENLLYPEQPIVSMAGMPLLERRCPVNVFAFDAVVLLEKEETSLVQYEFEGGRGTKYKAGRTEEDKKLTDEEYRARYDLTDADAEEILDLMYRVRHTPYETNGEVLNMIYEEAESYFTGERSLGDTCDVIQQRVQAYLDELE